MTDSRRPAPRHESESSPVLTAGGVVVQMFDDVPYTAIVHRPKFNDWSIPKGKVDPGETLAQTAVREIREETALECTLGEYLGPSIFLTARNWVIIGSCTSILTTASHRMPRSTGCGGYRCMRQRKRWIRNKIGGSSPRHLHAYTLDHSTAHNPSKACWTR